jgi:hypothetical protein
MVYYGLPIINQSNQIKSKSKSNQSINPKIIMFDVVRFTNWLVVSTPLKNMKVGWDDYSQYMET